MKRIMVSKTINPFWTILFIFILSNLLLYASTVEETFKKRIPFQSGGYLELINSNGSVEVEAWDHMEVEIIAYKRVRDGSRERAEKLLSELKIEVVQTANEIRIETITPHSWRPEGGFFNWLFGGDHHSYSVEYEIKVPKSIDLNIKTSNGKIYCAQIEGRVLLHSTNGKIVAREIKGLVRSRTTNGSLEIELISVPNDEEINFSTTNGSITVRLPENYGAKIDLKTTNGHIESDFPFTTRKSWSKRHIMGHIGDGSGTLICHTTNGSIHLYSQGYSGAEDISL